MNDEFKFYSYKIIINDDIGYNYDITQKKTSKYKFLNKIYKKIFGYKTVKTNNGIMYKLNNTIIMNKETFKDIKELVNVNKIEG
jgi:hypothetical protein